MVEDACRCVLSVQEDGFEYGYRHLSTELGRWPSRDPVLETGFRDTIWEYATAHFSPNGVSANEYGFVFNNPALFVDPQGAEIICGSIVIGVSAWELGAWLIASITAYYVIHEATDVAVVTIQGYVSDCGSCKKDKTRTEKTTRKRVKSKCVSGTWMVGHCGRNGPVSWDPACQLSPYAFGPTKGAAKAASLAGLPPTCWSAGVSYHHCNTFVCKGGAWIPTF